MDSWLQQFTNALPTGFGYYTLIFTIAFTESLLLVGLLVPGSVLIVFSGFLAANGKGDFGVLFALSTLGAFLGDYISFALGARFGGPLVHHPLLINRRRPLSRAFRLLRRHGAKSIFFGRFVGFLRPFIPFAAGCAHMRIRTFTGYALVSALLWGMVYPGLGYAFGTSWQRVQLWSGRLALLLLLALAVTLLTVWRQHRRRHKSR